MAKGDIVLITFPFTDLSGSKLRPAVVLADTSLDITVCFITTQIGWQEPTDVLLQLQQTGLRKAIAYPNKQNCNIRQVISKRTFRQT